MVFKEQLGYFRALETVVTDDWLELSSLQHDAVFTVPGLRPDQLRVVRGFMDRVIESGTTLREFTKSMRGSDPAIDPPGGEDFATWCRRTYENYLRQSYNAGRRSQMRKLRRFNPYWRYHASDCDSGSGHAVWHGLLLHADDPWWLTHSPANAWSCKCYLESRGPRDLVKLGKEGPDQAPDIEWVIAEGSGVRTPDGIDAGFAFAPGSSYEA